MTFVNTVTLKNKTNKVIRLVKSTRKPVIVTLHGQPAVAIVPLEESDIDVKLNGKYKRAIEQGLKDIKAGKTTTLKSFVQKHLR